LRVVEELVVVSRSSASTEDFLPALFRDTLDENDIRRLSAIFSEAIRLGTTGSNQISVVEL
jgi:hypothetical protein